MKNNLESLLQDRTAKFSIISSIAIIIVYVVLVGVSFTKLPPLLPLFNSLPWGTARLAPVDAVFVFPVLFLTIFILNNLAAAKIYRKQILMARVVSFNSLLVIILGLLAYVQILLLVF